MTSAMRCLAFFVQAEDGIRVYKVTGVQTCALPISRHAVHHRGRRGLCAEAGPPCARGLPLAVSGLRRIRGDRKSTRLNSSHLVISYAVFCLNKKKFT